MLLVALMSDVPRWMIRAIIHGPMTASRARRVTVRRYESAAEADRHDIEYRMQLSDTERVLQVWRLSLELAQLRGDPPYEPGLHRSVTHVGRR